MVTPELWSTSAHETYPSHFLQGYWTKKVKRDRVDKGELSLVAVFWVFAPYSYYEGWAHYTEQMVREEGLQQDAGPRDYQEYLMGKGPTSFCASAGPTPVSRCRWAACPWRRPPISSRPTPSSAPDAAEAEAIRGVYDPDYILYSVGKMMILQLRADYRAAVEARGETFSLREFHDRFLSLGQYTLPVVRAKLLDGLGAPARAPVATPAGETPLGLSRTGGFIDLPWENASSGLSGATLKLGKQAKNGLFGQNRVKADQKRTGKRPNVPNCTQFCPVFRD